MFGGDDFMRKIDRLKFAGHLQDISEALRRHGWKWKLTVWNDSGEEWEILPVSARQTKRPTIKVTAEISDEQSQDPSGLDLP